MQRRPRGPMDKASDYESGDSRFESWRGRRFFFYIKLASIVCRLINIQDLKGEVAGALES